MEEVTGRAIVIALIHTSSTGRLAPLDRMIWAGHVQFHPDESSSVTYWEWQSGVPLPPSATTLEESPLRNMTTTTNATSADTIQQQSLRKKKKETNNNANNSYNTSISARIIIEIAEQATRSFLLANSFFLFFSFLYLSDVRKKAKHLVIHSAQESYTHIHFSVYYRYFYSINPIVQPL